MEVLVGAYMNVFLSLLFYFHLVEQQSFGLDGCVPECQYVWYTQYSQSHNMQMHAFIKHFRQSGRNWKAFQQQKKEDNSRHLGSYRLNCIWLKIDFVHINTLIYDGRSNQFYIFLFPFALSSSLNIYA